MEAQVNQPRSAVERATGKSLPPDGLLASEASRLLEDVRSALHRDFGTATMAAGQLAALLERSLPQPAHARGGLAPWQKRKVARYVEEQLESPILIRDLAKLVSLSSGYFARAFKDSFGESPHAYIVRVRMERVRTLMLTTSEPLGQIALACGLSDQAHLCRRFRRDTGTTPRAWRRSHATGP